MNIAFTQKSFKSSDVKNYSFHGFCCKRHAYDEKIAQNVLHPSFKIVNNNNYHSYPKCHDKEYLTYPMATVNLI